MNYRGNQPRVVAWSDENVEILKRLWAEGVSAAGIASALKGEATRSAVIGKAHRLKLPPHSPETKRLNVVKGQRARYHPVSRPAPSPKPARAGAAQPRSFRGAAVEAGGPDLRQIYPPSPPKSHAAGSGAKVLADLGARECKWGVGPDPGRGNSERQLFCCEPAPLGAPYCEAHAMDAVQKHRTPEQRAADDARMAKMRAAKGCKPNQNTAFFANRGGRAA